MHPVFESIQVTRARRLRDSSVARENLRWREVGGMPLTQDRQRKRESRNRPNRWRESLRRVDTKAESPVDAEDVGPHVEAP